MDRLGKQSPKKHWRQIRVAAERGARRIARKGRNYDPLRWSDEHVVRPNPAFKIKGKLKGNSSIDFPSELRFDTSSQVDKAIEVTKIFRLAALRGHFKKVLIDHSKVNVMAPEVALLLLAEIQRCKAYCDGRTRITGTYPNNHDVSELLTEIGFFEALKIKAPQIPASRKPRTYLRIESKNKTLAHVVDSLLECFAKEFSFEEEDRKRLHVALIECMDNVFEHAYKVNPKAPYLYKEWWLAGYADHEDSSIGFIFYDQGAGIPTTIRKRQHPRVLDRLSAWTDGAWIERAVRKQISRHSSGRRGHGLEKLKKFLDRLDVEGSLRVVANTGDVEFFTSGKQTRVERLEQKLDGTLIVWKLKGIGNSGATKYLDQPNER
jgi:anti-sigma regulatory factor (Ser/Thr protein kinase)